MAPTLRLLPYDPDWPTRFATEAERLRSAIGDHVLAIEHVGSTAVPGLGGKSVLDVAIAVASEADAAACIAPLIALGYAYRGPYGEDPLRRYYVRDEGGVRFAHLHLYVMPAKAYEEKLAFRDALRGDPALAQSYWEEKMRVAELVGWDKAAYSEEKGAFVQRVLAGHRTVSRLLPLAALMLSTACFTYRMVSADTVTLALGGLFTAEGPVAGSAGRVAYIPASRIARTQEREFEAGKTVGAVAGTYALGAIVTILVILSQLK